MHVCALASIRVCLCKSYGAIIKWKIIQQCEDRLKKSWLEQLLHPCSLCLTGIQKKGPYQDTAQLFADSNNWNSIKRQEASGELQTSCVEDERYFCRTVLPLSWGEIEIQKRLLDFLIKSKTPRYCCAVMARKLMSHLSLMTEMRQFVCVWILFIHLFVLNNAICKKWNGISEFKNAYKFKCEW